MSAYNPYALRVGDQNVRAQVWSCSYSEFLGAFVVGVAGINGTEAYTPGDCSSRSVHIPYALAAQAFNLFDWVTFDVIGTYDCGGGPGSGILIDNINPA